MSGTVLDFPSHQERWVRKGELVDHFGVSSRTVERWMAAGMPYRKGIPGKKREKQDSVRFKLAECEAWLMGDTK
jgi:phage terminase Nu1 subunit (DNA packaging protein)